MVGRQRQVGGASELQPPGGRCRVREGPTSLQPQRKGQGCLQVTVWGTQFPGWQRLWASGRPPALCFLLLEVGPSGGTPHPGPAFRKLTGLLWLPLSPSPLAGRPELLRKLTGGPLSPANSCVLMSGKMRFLFITGALKIAAKWPTL